MTKMCWWLKTHSQHWEIDQEDQTCWGIKTHSQHRETDQEEKMCWWLKTCSQHRETDQEEKMCWWLKTGSQHRETDKKEVQMLWSLETRSQNWHKIQSVYPHRHSSTGLRTDEDNHNLYEQAIFSRVSCQAKSERTFINSLWKNICVTKSRTV